MRDFYIERDPDDEVSDEELFGGEDYEEQSNLDFDDPEKLSVEGDIDYDEVDEEYPVSKDLMTSIRMQLNVKPEDDRIPLKFRHGGKVLYGKPMTVLTPDKVVFKMKGDDGVYKTFKIYRLSEILPINYKL